MPFYAAEVFMVCNRNEVGKLKKLLIHRPGRELENLVPTYLERQLFDDIPWLEEAQREHDAYTNVAREHGVEVFEIRDLIAQTAALSEELKRAFLCDFLRETRITEENTVAALVDFLSGKDVFEMADILIAGLRKSEFDYKGQSLEDRMPDSYPFVFDPLPNMYFTRDPFSFVGNGVIISRMYSEARNRESLLGEFVLRNHPMFRGIPVYYDRTDGYSIEGGDVMVLAPDTLAIGVSQRTQAGAVEKVAGRILSDAESGFRKVLAVNIPKTRSYMHLDTVLTMVDKDKFAVHPNIEKEIGVFALSVKDGKFIIEEEPEGIGKSLEKHLGIEKVTFVRCGGNNYIDSEREQWNDGANTLVLSPGNVIVYARNVVTNALMRKSGLSLNEIPCSELSRGRGGPHCMSMAIERDLP